MATIPFKKLARMKIVPYKSEEFPPGKVQKDLTFTVMYNPSSLSISHGSMLAEKSTGDNTVNNVQTLGRKNGSFSVELFFDGTGASPSGGLLPGIVDAVAGLGGKTVTEQIDNFYAATLKPNNDIHEPMSLKISWGNLLFHCKLQSATTNYMLFDRDGNPLRATINASFIQISAKGDGEIDKSSFKSADLTKVYQVKAGDTIYNIAKDMYDDESFYLQIAETNSLKNYRKLIPGQQLILPPVKKV